jgi:hypothetical protein
MRSPLVPVKVVKGLKKKQTIEDILTAFVETASPTTFQDWTRNDVCQNITTNVPNSDSKSASLSVARSCHVLKTAMHDMIFTFAISVLKTSSISPTFKSTVTWGTKNALVQRYCRARSSKELPKIILFYIHCLRRRNNNNNNTAINHSRRDNVITSLVLKSLVSYLFHNTTGIVSTRQRQHIQFMLKSLTTMNEKRNEMTMEQHHNQKIEKEPFHGVTIKGPRNRVDDDDDIDASKIVFHLRVLKKGGYWQHLPREDIEHYDDEDEEEENNLHHGTDRVGASAIDTIDVSSSVVAASDVEKENSSHLGNRGQTSIH